MKNKKFKKNEVVIYQNGDNFELGIIKTVKENNKYFVNYHTDDIANLTLARNLHKIKNIYAFDIRRKKEE
ncbi:MAG TPA: hypothetical protein GX530_08930 [Corynebacteriales bacterium]|nr:hypothetical protein [Mycobacteriales bacterium]